MKSADGTPIRCVAFDLDGVVIPTAPSFDYFDSIHGITFDDWRQFFQGPYESAMRGDVDLFEILRESLERWRWNTSIETFAKEWFDSCSVPDPQAIEVIHSLKARGIRCVAATNQDSRRARYLDALPWLGLFDARFYSCDLRVTKPSTEYFRHIQDTIAEVPGSVLFVDDRGDNVEAARRFGWCAEHCLGASELKRIVSEYCGRV